MIVDKMANMHIYEKTIPQIKEIIPILDQAKDMEVGTYMYPWGKVMIQEGNTRHLGEGEFESDAMFWKGMGSVLEVPAGVFYIAFPEDGHKPCCHKIKRSHYKKMVIKIKAEKD